MLAIVIVIVSMSNVLALESHHVRGEGMMETTRVLKKKNNAKCITGTAAVVNDWCVTNNCCGGRGGCGTSTDSVGGVLTVCADACNGLEACSAFPSGTVVHSNSCNGESACKSRGEGVVIQSGSCLGKEACNDLGDSTTIEAGACVGKFSCWYLGFGDDKKVTVGAGACKGVSACAGVGRRGTSSGVATSITIGAGSCQGKESCRNVGYDATAISIAKGACATKFSCTECASKFSCTECASVSFGPLSITGQTCPV